MEQNKNAVKFKKSYVRNNGSLMNQRQITSNLHHLQASSTVPRTIPIQEHFNQFKAPNHSTFPPNTPHDHMNHSQTLPNVHQINSNFANLSMNSNNIFHLPIINEGIQQQFPRIIIDDERKKRYEQQKLLTNQASMNPFNNRISSEIRQMPTKYAGLYNLGNTCYMNSILQCLAHTSPLRDLWRENKLVNNRKAPLFMAFCDLLQDMKDNEKFNPTKFLRQVRQSTNNFEDFQQQDAQEFLMILLEGLSRDLSKKATSKKRDSVRLCNREDKRADSAWKKYLASENTPIVDIFMGQLKSTLICSSCSSASNTFDPVMGLSLPIPSETKLTTLKKCLELYFQKEILDGEDKMVCQHCQMRCSAQKTTSIQKFPKVFIIHLKRFSNDLRRKVDTMVEFPLKGMYLDCFSQHRGDFYYDLYALVSHYGTPNEGHYTALVRVEDKWMSFDDDVVQASPPPQTDHHTYILFYLLKYSPNTAK